MTKRAIISIIMLLCLALCACSSGVDSAKDEIVREYSEASEFTVNADIKADLGGSVFEYGVKYSGTPERGTLTVLSPESIAGIEIQTDSTSGETMLIYDGARLWTGSLDENGLDPVSALPLMIGRWHSGYVTEASSELSGGSRQTSLTYTVSEGTVLKTLFDPATLLPSSAEIVSSGKTVIFCSFKDVTIN